MNEPLFCAFLLTFFLSFDAAVTNIYAGSVAFMGSILGVTLVAFNSVDKENNIKK
jgi:hypothetical protein